MISPKSHDVVLNIYKRDSPQYFMNPLCQTRLLNLILIEYQTLFCEKVKINKTVKNLARLLGCGMNVEPCSKCEGH